ncbi:MAG: hypothetical protein WDN47_05285 [Candidatus Doudnabacteria bacterium]
MGTAVFAARPVLVTPTLANVLEDLQITVFSPDAVSAYKAQVRQEALAAACWSERMAVAQPRLLAGIHKLCCAIMWTALGSALGIVIGILALVADHLTTNFASLGWTSLTFYPAAGFILSVAALVAFSYAESGLDTAAARTVNYEWTISPVHRNRDIPHPGLMLMKWICHKLPQAEFEVHRLGADPFLKVIYIGRRGIESEYFYGWDGLQDLIEVDGKIIAVPSL